jgi:mono/diheme cytochrome c family protein
MAAAKLFLKLTLTVFACFSIACSEDDSTDVDNPNPTPAELLARGDYLVNHVAACSDCHTPRDEAGAPIAAQFLSGTECFVQLENGNCLNSRNLTDHETGLANRTDAEIKRMLRDGIRPAATGDEALFPAMPYYVFHNITDSDLDAIVAFLRTVPGVDHAVPRSGPEFELPSPAQALDLTLVPEPSSDYAEQEAAQRGRYLAAGVGVCLECHTQHVMGDPKVLDYEKFFAGGERFEIGLPVVPVSSNLTSDMQTGLGEWTVEDIVKAVKEATDKEGDGVCPPMPAGPMAPFGGITDEDALDIAHYIKSLPPVVNEIDDMCTWPLP